MNKAPESTGDGGTPLPRSAGSPFPVTQRTVDRIVARAQNSAMGLGDPDKGRRSYDLNQYSNPGLQELAILLVSAHFGKWDIISLFAAALEELDEHHKAND